MQFVLYLVELWILFALSGGWKLQSHAHCFQFNKKCITEPVIEAADITVIWSFLMLLSEITTISFGRDDGGRLCLGVSGWSQRKAERSGHFSDSEWHVWGSGQFGPEFLALSAPAVLQRSRVTTSHKSFYTHRDILNVIQNESLLESHECKCVSLSGSADPFLSSSRIFPSFNHVCGGELWSAL